jgi:hypothetical protein
MIRFIRSALILLLLTFALTGCTAGKKSSSELRGLMLLENTQLGRNKSYYSKHKAKKYNSDYRKYDKKKRHNKGKVIKSDK